MSEEFYIRRDGDEDAIGPYNFDQLSSLVDAGKLDGDAYYYDMESEKWLKISSNQELMGSLYPTKRKLSLRKTDEADVPVSPEEEAPNGDKVETPSEEPTETPSPEDEENEQSDDLAGEPSTPEENSEAESPTSTPTLAQKEEEPQKELSVVDMLAAAEGRHLQDTHGKTPTEIKAKVAYLCMQQCIVLLFVSAATMIYMDLDNIMSADAVKILKSPFVIVALIDILLGLFLSLQVTALYPLIRFRAAIGIGFFTMIFFSIGQPILLIGNLLMMGAIYFATAVVELKKAYILLAVALLGILSYAYVFVLPLITGA
ncbi:hypothetical protein MLD52_07420 [Puniceicoccaceae bacterium K14]|nr:hypothetical protein [Puniceicoccaceae bacterium K14]